MTDVSNLDELADAISSKSPQIKKSAQAQATATQSQEAEIRSLADRVAALEAAPEPEPVPPEPIPPEPVPPSPADEYWHVFNAGEWPNQHKGSASTITNVAKPQPAGSPTGNWIRYFLKDGSLWNNTERCEGSTDHGPPMFTEGQVVWWRWWLMLEQFPVHPTSDWNIISQAHLPGGGQPTIIFAFTSDRRFRFKTSEGVTHVGQWLAPSPMPLGKVTKIKLGCKLGSTLANGWVELHIDDVNVLPRKPAITLSPDPTLRSLYWKAGLYRNMNTVGDSILYQNGLQTFKADPE